MRSLRLLKFLKGINKIVESLLLSLSFIGHLMLFYAVLLFIFGVFCVVLVGAMCTSADQQQKSVGASRCLRCLLVSGQALLDEFSSFQNMEMAFLTLIRLTTGDGWAGVMNKASLAVTDFPRTHPEYLAETAKYLRLWNASDDKNVLLKKNYLKEARRMLPGCATSSELDYLRLERLVDCSSEEDMPFETPCVSTCGNVFMLFAIPIYIFLSQSTVLNLIVAILIVNMRSLDKKVGKTGKSRITE
jgi:hypothetical protein